MEAYTSQIYSIIKRFKDLKFEGNCWRNANSSSKKFHDDSSWFELATAVWNTASLHSQVAVFKIQEESNLDEGESSIKNACSIFQRCAGILSFLQKKSTGKNYDRLTVGRYKWTFRIRTISRFEKWKFETFYNADVATSTGGYCYKIY